MRANTTARLRGAFRVRVFAAALCAMSATASATRIFATADGIGTAGDSMGSAVALSGDTAAVGIPQGVMTPHAAPGVIAIFRNVAGTWQREAFLGPGFPSVFALQQDMLVVGGAHVATFLRDGTTWSQHDSLDTSASSVALSGETLLVSGTPASVYTRDNGAWTPQATLAGDQPDETIFEVAIDGDVAAVAGFVHPSMVTQAYVHFYHRSGAVWLLESTLPAGGGLTTPPIVLAVSDQTVLVGTSQVDAYVRDPNGDWSLQGTLDPLVTYLPDSAAIEGDRAVVGSPGDDIPGVNGAGTAYVFERSGGTWSRTDHLYDPGATFGAGFGSSVALEGDTVVAGSPRRGHGSGTGGLRQRHRSRYVASERRRDARRRQRARERAFRHELGRIRFDARCRRA